MHRSGRSFDLLEVAEKVFSRKLGGLPEFYMDVG